MVLVLCIFIIHSQITAIISLWCFLDDFQYHIGDSEFITGLWWSFSVGCRLSRKEAGQHSSSEVGLIEVRLLISAPIWCWWGLETVSWGTVGLSTASPGSYRRRPPPVSENVGSRRLHNPTEKKQCFSKMCSSVCLAFPYLELLLPPVVMQHHLFVLFFSEQGLSCWCPLPLLQQMKNLGKTNKIK